MYRKYGGVHRKCKSIYKLLKTKKSGKVAGCKINKPDQGNSSNLATANQEI